jgi:hypothetical protein
MSAFDYLWPGQLKNVIFYDYVITNSYALANSYQAAGTVLYTSGSFFLYKFGVITKKKFIMK